jgi:hypothetical protein
MRSEDFTTEDALELGVPWPGRDWRDFEGADRETIREGCYEERGGRYDRSS